MKKSISLYLLTISLLFFQSCSKEPVVGGLASVSTSLASEVSTNSVLIGGIVSNIGDSPVTSRGICWSTNQNPKISDNKSINGEGAGTFSTTISGLTTGTTYYFRAYATNSAGTSYGDEVSATPSPTPLLYEKSVLLEQFTGTWCGYCPRAIGQIEDLIAVDTKIAHVAHHLNDEMTYSENSALFQSFGLTGVPTVYADRTSFFTGSSATITPLHAPANIGLGLKVTGAGTTITARVTVKFGKFYSEGLKLTIYLITDNKIADQVNYYNNDVTSRYYQMGSPIKNFVHKNVMTKAGTDMFGEAIPPVSVVHSGSYVKTADFTGLNSSSFSNIKVVAFVTYSNGIYNKRVVNAIIGSVGDDLDQKLI